MQMGPVPVMQMPTREVIRCEHCLLVQYRTKDSNCRRCHKSLDMPEPAPAPGPVPVVGAKPVAPETEAGLQVAAQVKEIRRARHLSQRQLAGRMQVPRTYISKIENGKAIPTLGSLERIANALEVDVCQLVRDTRSRREEENEKPLPRRARLRVEDKCGGEQSRTFQPEERPHPACNAH